jgi:hypothetical protein
MITFMFVFCMRILVDSYEILQQFLKNITSELKSIHFVIKSYTCVSALPAVYCLAFLNVTDGKACIIFA